MSINLNTLFLYLEKESIAIDKTEYEFQLQSHPDYGSLLAMSDTLSFLNIDNLAISLSASKIDLLPGRFLVLLKRQDYMPQLHLIEKKGEHYHFEEGGQKQALSKPELEKRWEGMILLAERAEDNDTDTNTPKKNNRVVPAVLFAFFLVLLFQSGAAWSIKLFVVFPIAGVLLSVAALKDLFGAQSRLLDNFCNISASTGCSSVVGSNKWKIFEYIKFSDLSIAFFGAQFFGLLLSLLSEDALSFIHIQEILLACSMPLIALSVYFQKVVEKKWCPICLSIISLVIIESVYLFYTVPFEADFTFNSAIVYGFVFLSVFFIWSSLNKLFVERKELKKIQFKSNRFIRNYEIFRSTLISGEKTKLSYSPIVLGNKDSDVEISIITNPFCGYCKEAHEILDKILLSHGENLKIKVLINADIDRETEENKLFFRNLMRIFMEKGGEAFRKTLNDWYKNPDVAQWNTLHTIEADSKEIDALYKQQNQWCVDNNSFQTPTIFINGYRYPKMYDRENLEFFIKEIIEDLDFH